MKRLNLSHRKEFNVAVDLPASKSISNRLLIIDALAGGGSHIQNLSSANDTVIMKNLLSSQEVDKNVEDAGAVMRFLTAFYGIDDEEVLLRGTDRMHDRPIGVLVDALKLLGASITYEGRPGYPPLRIGAFKSNLACHELEIDSSVSSQYVSALLMIATRLPNGRWIKLKGEVSS